MDNKIRNFLKESLLYFKDYGYKAYLEKYACDKKEILSFAKKLHTTIDYRGIEEHRKELFEYLSSKLEKKNFDIKQISIDEIELEKKDLGGLMIYKSEVKVSTAEHIAVFNIGGITEYDGKLLSDGILDLENIYSLSPHKYIVTDDTNIYSALQTFDKSSKHSDDAYFDHIAQQTATLEEIDKTAKKLDIVFPPALVNYWSEYSNGNKNKNSLMLEVFPHQNIMGITDFFNYIWKEYYGVDEINVYSHKDMYTPYTQEQKLLVDEMNKNFFVFAADGEDNFMEMLVFDKSHNAYGFIFDQDLIAYPYIEGLHKGIYKKHKDIKNFFAEYINLKIAYEIDGENVSVLDFFVGKGRE